MGEFGIANVGHEPQPPSSSRDLILVVEPSDAKPEAEQRPPAAGRLFLSRFHFAAAAALAIVLAVAGALFLEDRLQAKALAEQASENAALAHTLKSLKVRLDAIDSAMSNAGLADLRQSVGEIRSNLVSSREFSGALAQLSQRVDKLDHEASAKVDKLTERVRSRSDCSDSRSFHSHGQARAENRRAAPSAAASHTGQAIPGSSEIRQRRDGQDGFNRATETSSSRICRARRSR